MGMAVLVGSLPFVAMVMLEFGEIVMVTLSKAAMNNGMSSFVYGVYYNSLGTFLLFPLFIFYRHRNGGVPLTLPLLSKFFLLGLLGICFVQVFGYAGIRYSSPTLAAAMGNLIPGLTFLLAVIFRMEKLAPRSTASQAKVLGTITSISGAFIVTLYKGPPILGSQKSNWVFGGLLLTVTEVSYSAWNVVQAVVLKEHPEKMTLIFFSCLFGTVQCAVVSLVAEPNISAWTLHSGIEVIAVAYGAVLGTVLRTSIYPWVLQKKGPIFVALFKPLGTVIAVIMGVMFLGETPHVGSLVGAIVISAGFYAVIWGQDKERDDDALESSSKKTPFLQSTT